MIEEHDPRETNATSERSGRHGDREPARLAQPSLEAQLHRAADHTARPAIILRVAALDLERRLAVARGDEPADLVIRGGPRLLRLHAGVAGRRRGGRRRRRRRARRRTRAARARRVGALPRARLHRPAPPHRVVEAPDRRVRAARAAARAPRRSSPTRTRSRTSSAPTACTGSATPPRSCRSTSTSWPRRASPPRRFESPRRELTPGDLEGLLRRRNVLGLAEMMNFPGVVSGRRASSRSSASRGTSTGTRPGVSGKSLNAYAAAGIESDHEAATLEEGRERLRAGLWLLIREASSARNLAALLAARRRVRAVPDGVLHRRPRAGARRRRRPHQRDRARRGGARRAPARTRS